MVGHPANGVNGPERETRARSPGGESGAYDPSFSDIRQLHREPTGLGLHAGQSGRGRTAWARSKSPRGGGMVHLQAIGGRENPGRPILKTDNHRLVWQPSSKDASSSLVSASRSFGDTSSSFMDTPSSTLDAFRESLDASTNSWTRQARFFARPERSWARLRIRGRAELDSGRIQSVVGRVHKLVDGQSVSLDAARVTLGREISLSTHSA
jgi:hypothetical protein